MEILDKAKILLEFTNKFFNDEEYDDFFSYNDLGVPMAVMVVNELVELTKAGKDILNETYTEMCNAIGVDSEENFDSLDDILDSLL